MLIIKNFVEETPQNTDEVVAGASQTLLANSSEDILQEAMRLADEMSIPPIEMSTALDVTPEIGMHIMVNFGKQYSYTSYEWTLHAVIY